MAQRDLLRAGRRQIGRAPPAPEGFRADKPLPVKAVATQSAKEACDLVLARAGAKVRDADDLRVIEEVKARTGRVGRGRQ